MKPAWAPTPTAWLVALALLVGQGCGDAPEGTGGEARTAATAFDAGSPGGEGSTSADDTGPAADGGEGAPGEAASSTWPADAPALRKGLVAGTWSPGPEGFEEAFLDEAGVREAYTSRPAGRRTWRGMASGSDTVPMDTLLRDRDGPAIGYLFALVSRAPVLADPFAEGAFPDARGVLHVRHASRLRVWYDGQLVLDEPPSPDGSMVVHRAEVPLTGAFDVVLVKVARGSEALGPSMDFEARLSGLDGATFEGQRWNTMRPPGLPSDLTGD